MLRVKSLAASSERFPKGEFFRGQILSLPEGKFAVKFYPNGAASGDGADVSLYVEVLSFTSESTTALKIAATTFVLDGENNVLKTLAFTNLPSLSPSHLPGSSSSGWEKYMKRTQLPETFTITVDVVVVESVRKQSTTASGLESLSVDGAVQQLRDVVIREIEKAKVLKLPTEEQLQHCSHNDLLELQESLTKALAEKVREESTCQICMERNKDTALVPCGHRCCSKCAVPLLSCPECRQPIQQKMKLF